MTCSRRMLSFVVAALVSACGGGQNEAVSTSSESASPPAAARPTAQATAPPNRCPLTAAQVSAALGTTVVGPVEGVCRFEPATGTGLPEVLFVRQFGGACGGNLPAEIGYKEQVPGLGATAYIADMPVGMRMLVCQSPSPFEITVKAEPAQLRRDAAIALARQILAGS